MGETSRLSGVGGNPSTTRALLVHPPLSPYKHTAIPPPLQKNTQCNLCANIRLIQCTWERICDPLACIGRAGPLFTEITEL